MPKKTQSTLSGFFKPKAKDAATPAPKKRKLEDDSPITPEQRRRMEDSRKLALMDQPKTGHFQRLRALLTTEYTSKTIFPPKNFLFEAFKRCDFKDVRVVIVGQDPYHGPGQAHGLCFSVQEGIKVPPSLRNVFKELKTDSGGLFVPPKHGNLTKWADQANSHRKKGWEEFTDAVIRAISEKKEGVVFLCWGRPAEAKTRLVLRRKHCVLTSSHPSPLGATKTKTPFIGCRHFSKANTYLKSKGKKEIDWQL